MNSFLLTISFSRRFFLSGSLSFVQENFLEQMDKQATAHATINSYYFMLSISEDIILGILLQDAGLALFSLAFVFFWLRLFTGSWFLAVVGLAEIFFSIPIAWFLFTVVFQIKFFVTLNTLALFVVAAIGADDICECISKPDCGSSPFKDL